MITFRQTRGGEANQQLTNPWWRGVRLEGNGRGMVCFASISTFLMISYNIVGNSDQTHLNIIFIIWASSRSVAPACWWSARPHTPVLIASSTFNRCCTWVMLSMFPFIDAISSSSSVIVIVSSVSIYDSWSDMAEIYPPILLTLSSHLVYAYFFAWWIAHDIT